MIIEIPTEKDFLTTGENLFNTAWGQLCELLMDFSEIGSLSGDWEVNKKDEERYWLAAKQTLITALPNVQQGVEFFIKGKIAAISPYLLISGPISHWPRGCDKKDIPFSNFHAVDAQDLIKIHDTISELKFSKDFKQLFENMRSTRNRIMHTVDLNLKVLPQDLAQVVLEAHKFLAGEKKWIRARIKYLDNSPEYSIKYIRELNYHSYIKLQIFEELAEIINLLPPSKIRKYFGFEKKAKSYHCSNCYDEISSLDFFDPDYHGAILKPLQRIEMTENTYKCFICDYQVEPVDFDCTEEFCKGKLFDPVKRRCLECGSG